MDLYTQRPPSTVDGWAEETRNVELAGVLDRDGQPFVVTIRRLPAGEVYQVWETDEKGAVRETYRRWAQLAVVAPQFSFNGDEAGITWDSLPFAAHEGLARRIATFSFETSAEASALEAAFRGGQPAGAGDGNAGRGPGGDGELASGEPAAPAPGAPDLAGGGAAV